MSNNVKETVTKSSEWEGVSAASEDKLESQDTEWEDTTCHSPTESPDQDSGCPSGIRHNVEEDMIDTAEYGCSSGSVIESPDFAGKIYSTNQNRSSSHRSSGSGSDVDSSEQSTFIGDVENIDPYYILEKVHLPEDIAMRTKPKDGNERVSRSSSVSRRGVIYNDYLELMQEEMVEEEQEGDDELSDDGNGWGSEFSSDEFSDCQDGEAEDHYDNINVHFGYKTKLYKIAEELVTTERTYVQNLYLLDQVFQKRIKTENETKSFLPPEVVPQIFSNIASIYQFHSDYLLPKLEERIKNWISTPKVGDILKVAAPFFKLYTEFMKNFDNSMNVIQTSEERCPAFADILTDIQCSPECNRLSLKHHMLGPVQRLPRYELLLKDYIKHLPKDSDDIADSKDALELVTKATNHANEAIKNEKFHEMIEINERLGCQLNLITPTRQLVKEGCVIKITARRGERQERYLFLFDDILLVCSQYLLGTYSLKICLSIDDIEVVEKGDAEYTQVVNDEENLDIPNTFYVRSRKKILQFCYQSSDDENFNWCSAIKQVVKEFKEKKKSFLREDCSNTDVLYVRCKTGCHRNNTNIIIDGDLECISDETEDGERNGICLGNQKCCKRIQRKRKSFLREDCSNTDVLYARCQTGCQGESKSLDFELGQTAPKWVKDYAVTMCMKCGSPFSAVKRRHHCRACGFVVRRNCSAKKIALVYDDNNINRVCDSCFDALNSKKKDIMTGYLNVSKDKGRTWKKKWFSARSDFFLYYYNARKDICPSGSYNLKDCSVEELENGQHIFKLTSSSKIVHLYSDSTSTNEKWIKILKKMVSSNYHTTDLF